MEASHRPGEAGVVLVAVILILALLLGLSAALMTSVNMDTNLRGAFHRATAGFYAAESGLNRGMGDYRNIFLTFNVPSGTDFDPQTITVGTRTVNYKITDTTAYDASHNPPSITIPPGQLFGGLDSIEYDYIATSSALSQSDTEASVNAEFKVGYIPLFQFVAFYKKDLEVAPGADMTLHGRVHSNADLYLDADGPTLTISDNPPAITTVSVTAAGNIYRGRKRSNTCESPGTVTVDMLQDTVAPIGNLDPQNLNCNGSSTRNVPSSELATWKGSMVNQIESISVPDPDNTARGNGVYWTKADLRIVLNLTTTWTPPAAGAPTQFTIEVQNADGTQDAPRTTLLRNFMAATAWNTANSSWPGTRPIFYTDRPITSGNPNNCNCTDTTPSGCTNTNALCYSPPFAPVVPTSTPATPTSAQNNRVYATGVTMTNYSVPLGTATPTATRNTRTPTATATPTTDADYRRGGFYNWREKKWMYLLNVNLSDLLRWNAAQAAGSQLFDPADRTDGGVVLFLSVQGPESDWAANRYGARIFGSSTLPFPNVGADPTGVTVVSDQALYVQGDYNTAATIATGWQPSALIGDSVNVLSNAYFALAPAANTLVNDAQSNQALDHASRSATTTTIHTAFLGGVDDTIASGGASGYNGGLENYPRFHESWSGTSLNYLGSFVSLGNPQHVSGPWCGTGTTCNIYNPPARNWDYDAQFNNAANLPPLTPRFVYVQQVLFTEQFK